MAAESGAEVLYSPVENASGARTFLNSYSNVADLGDTVAADAKPFKILSLDGGGAKGAAVVSPTNGFRRVSISKARPPG